MFRRSSLIATTYLGKVPVAPPDPILGLGLAFQKDTHPKKVNLAVGVYRGDDGKPYILESVKKAKVVLTDMEYAPIAGRPAFVRCSQRLAFGSDAITEERLASAQALSGTGALRLAGAFISRFSPGTPIYLPVPTWGNHHNIFRDCGIPIKTYRYYDKANNTVDMKGMLEDLSAVEPGSAVLFHACAHNPTGCDPTIEQWKQLRALAKEKSIIPFFDAAYLGFASGSPEKDRAAIDLFSDVDGLIVCQSMAKNFGLYGQRIGAVHFVCPTSEVQNAVSSQLKQIIRPMYSNPPIQGAYIVEAIMASPELTAQWHEDLKTMANRMNGVRVRLVDQLKAIGSQRNWSHITQQIGMMAFTGLSPQHVEALREKYHIYMTTDGRAAISGLNASNVEYVANAFHDVTK